MIDLQAAEGLLAGIQKMERGGSTNFTAALAHEDVNELLITRNSKGFPLRLKNLIPVPYSYFVADMVKKLKQIHIEWFRFILG